MVDTTQERKAAASLQEDEKPAPKSTEPMHGQVIIEFVRKNEKPQVSFPFIGGIWQASDEQKKFCGEEMAKQSAIDYAEELKGKGISKISIQSFELTAKHREGAQGFPRAIWMENGHLCERMTGVSIITKPDGDELIPEKPEKTNGKPVPTQAPRAVEKDVIIDQTEDEKMQVLSVTGCARCGEDHESLSLFRFMNSKNNGPEGYLICPNTQQPIVVRIEIVFE